MDVTDLKLNSRYWCWWLHRILLYRGKTNDGMYIFEDFGDEEFYFTEYQVRKFKPYKGGTKYE